MRRALKVTLGCLFGLSPAGKTLMETNVVIPGSDMDHPSPLYQARNAGNLIPVTSCQGTLAQPNERSLEEN